MPTNLKALIVVLTLSIAAFQFSKPIVRKFCNEQDFSRRRNLWLIFTVICLLSPSFWLFTLIAAPLLIWAGRKDSNPIALYVLLLHAVPPLEVEIPVIGINTLFALNMYRLLAFCVLLPIALRLRKQQKATQNNRSYFAWTDGLLLAYGVMQILIFNRPDTPDAASLHDSATNVIRRGLLFLIDTYLPYYAVSRFCSTRRILAEVMASACIAIIVMAPAAIFEHVRHWLLYGDIAHRWGAGLDAFYTMRAGLLRASLAAGHPLALGYLFAIGLGLWLYLQAQVKSVFVRIGVPVLLILGLVAAYSRGPWLGAAVIYFAFTGLSLGGKKRLVKAVLIGIGSCGVLLLSPLGNRIIAVIPFLGGTVDQYNVTYRERLAERTRDMILHGPLFGDPNAYLKMEDLRQGVGVIDLVNTYAEVGIFYGIVGLTLFVGFILVALLKVYLSSRRMASVDYGFASMGLSISACILGTLVMIYTSSFIFSYVILFYVLAGMAVAYQKCSSTFQAGSHEIVMTAGETPVAV
jgi:hypothetical protein